MTTTSVATATTGASPSRTRRCAAGPGALLAALGLLAAPAARASIVFTPHLSEYSTLSRGAYADATAVYTSIDKVYDANGNKVPLGQNSIPPGSRVNASLILARFLWVGNAFEHTSVPFLKNHNQILRVIGTAGHQQATGDIPALSRQFGQTSGASGLGDVFVLGGLYTDEYALGPVKANGLWATTVKLPVGRFEENSLLNNGTHYWTVIPQFAAHANLFGRLFFDGTVAYQKNGRNDSPAYGGLTPTRPADVVNVEGNLALKFTEHFYADVGYGQRKSRGPNRFDKVTLNFVDQPLPATQACNALGVPAAQCSLTDQFFLQPVDGPREDKGVEQRFVTASLYYIYRASSVINFRVFRPVGGRGSQFPAQYDVFLGRPGGGNRPISRLDTTLTGVQEAASMPASPFYELRFVYLFWAP